MYQLYRRYFFTYIIRVGCSRKIRVKWYAQEFMSPLLSCRCHINFALSNCIINYCTSMMKTIESVPSIPRACSFLIHALCCTVSKALVMQTLLFQMNTVFMFSIYTMIISELSNLLFHFLFQKTYFECTEFWTHRWKD